MNMMPFIWLRNMFFETESKDLGRLILPINKQVKAWHRANRKMAWGIHKEEFEWIMAPPLLMKNGGHHGFIGTALFYGFGDDGAGNADSVLSGKLAWEYARKRLWKKTWQCEYIDFDRVDDIRLRPGAPSRPKGFYFAKLKSGDKNQSLTVSQVRKHLNNDTGWGPEGIQFLAITHTHFQKMMDKREIPFMALADYDVAPYGFNDFFDAAQLFCSYGVLGLGIGNVDRNYPLFGIPTLHLERRSEAFGNSPKE